ncbi:hypothetical protein KDA06_05335 [Candidatus Saccharibacteria bacterium]|nr:hypothetical protein [Candidatus Saccharibacteria bacterium]
MVEIKTSTAQDILYAYRLAKEFEDLGKRIKDYVKKEVPKILDEQGRSPEVDGYIIKSYESQRMTYNRMALYNAFGDEDLVQEFMDVSKGKVDAYIKEHDLTPEQIETLRSGLEPAGKVINSVRLERV